MPFGAHEAMEVHEVLMEKINVITHFNLYAKQAKNPQLQDMIMRHQQEEILSYNEIVALTRGNDRFNPIPPNTNIQGVNRQQIQYGLNQMPRFAPQADPDFDDVEIAIAMLLCHKNGARNCTWATLECADPNLRRTLFNCAATCTNQAYEVFLFMNQQGMYPVPTLNDQLLRSYQPADGALAAQYGMQNGAGYNGASAYGAGYSQPGMSGGSMNPGSRESVLYGDGRGQSTYYSGVTNPSVYGPSYNQGMMQQ